MNSFCLVCSLMIMMRKSLGRITFKPIHFIHFVSSRVLFAYIYIHTAVISKPIIIFTLGVFSLLYSDFSFRFVTTIDEYTHMFHENPSLSKKEPNTKAVQVLSRQIQEARARNSRDIRVEKTAYMHTLRRFISLLIILFASTGLSF